MSATRSNSPAVEKPMGNAVSDANQSASMIGPRIPRIHAPMTLEAVRQS